MTEIQNLKREYDLEERTLQFAKAVRLFVKTLPKPVLVIEYCNLRFICNLVLVI